MSNLGPKLPLRQRARKAFVAAYTAGTGAAVSTLLAGLVAEVPRTREGWFALFGAAVGFGVTAALAAGVATFNTRNPGQPAGGSDPVMAQPSHRTPMR